MYAGRAIDAGVDRDAHYKKMRATCKRFFWMNAMDPTDDEIARAIEALLATRRAEASICPSEAARRLRPDGWRALMPAVRRVAFGMAHAGRLRITQGATTIAGDTEAAGSAGVRGTAPDDPIAVRGAIRLRRPLLPR